MKRRKPVWSEHDILALLAAEGGPMPSSSLTNDCMRRTAHYSGPPPYQEIRRALRKLEEWGTVRLWKEVRSSGNLKHPVLFAEVTDAGRAYLASCDGSKYLSLDW